MEYGEINRSVKEKIEKARKELLDLGFRNRLINYRNLKTKGVHIIDELSYQLYDMLVQKGNLMYFLPDLEEDSRKGLQELGLQELLQPDGENNDDIADRHKDNKIQTPHNSRRLQDRLLKTYYAANTHIQERGVNVLYLALGMLHWYEDESSERLRKSPLLLIPIELSRSNAQSKFKVKYTGDEVGGNLSLRAKLKMDYGINLDMPEDSENIDVTAYFKKLKKKIKNQSRWEIIENEQTIGFFSFNKFLMYHDLGHENWPIDQKPSQHLIIQSLFEDGFKEVEPLISAEDCIDDFLDPRDIKHVVDADSSQIRAICEVNQGRNLVIQGPPGTGKSQTITNIIAESIAMDKTVLFVSEKMAALEVVKRRLDEVGLGMACIELHSYKSNKKVFLEELQKTLRLDKPINENEFNIEALKKNRDELNRYSAAVNKVMGNSSITPYQAYGKILKIKNQLGEITTPNISPEKLLKLELANFRDAYDTIEKLQLRIENIGRPIDHPFWGSNKLDHLPFHNEEIKNKLENSLDSLDELVATQQSISNYLNLNNAEAWSEGEMLIKTSNIALETPDYVEKVNVVNKTWLNEHSRIGDFIETGRRIAEVKYKHREKVIHEAWSEEVLGIRKTLIAKGDKWWRFLSRDYWRARNDLAGLMVDKLPKELKSQIDLVDAIMEYQRLKPELDDYSSMANELFQSLYKDEKSDWETLDKINSWLYKLHKLIDSDVIPSTMLPFFQKAFDKHRLTIEKEKFIDRREKYKKSIEKLFDELIFQHDKRFPKSGLWSQDYSTIYNMLEDQLSNVEKVSEIADLNHGFKQLDEIGFNEVIRIACEWRPAGKHLAKLFELNWLEAYLEEAIKERESLSGFNSEAHWNKIKKFRSLDTELLKQNRAELALKHWDNLPSMLGIGSLGLLRREFNKKRRHLPIRKLIDSAGAAIQAIKPVFMMSPLSVSSYLPPGSIDFDLVVFDEASQVRPIDALSPILRAKQVVVVGDSKQLPPTSFFDVELELEDEEEQAVAADMESILGLFESMGAPRRMLRWHYRSEHESLIAISNYEFYDNKLKLFPSPDVGMKKSGINYKYLEDTYYEPGRGKSYNIGEAKAVAKAVLKHANENPHLSLGVAAFSKSQMTTIQDELEILRRKDSSFESFFNDHSDEPFFVKNLENVQGDERDIIFISIGYGKTQDGSISMNFGPLNHDGGERRLNVLITRARKRCEIFTNIMPQDIDTNRTKAKGMIVLKKYLKYAQTGVLDIPRTTDNDPDSLFEEDVAHELRQHGYKIEYQVGSAGFLIDLGVRDPNNTSEFIMGVECDGAAYHSARSARDRDRIRQNVLERIGWNIYRVWSTDWFKNKEKEVSKLLQNIKWHLKNDVNELSIKRTDQVQSKISKPSYSRIGEETDHEVLSQPYQQAQISDVNALKSTYFAKYGNLNAYEALIEKISKVESPIHRKILFSSVADHLGYGRMGRKIKSNIESALKTLIDKEVISYNDGFIYHQNSQIKVRDRTKLPGDYRKIWRIAPEEIQKAILILAEKSYGAVSDELIKETGSLFGISRITRRTYNVIDENLQKLINNKDVDVEGDKVYVADT